MSFRCVSYSGLQRAQKSKNWGHYGSSLKEKAGIITEDASHSVCAYVHVCVCHIYSRRIPGERPCDWPPPHTIWQDIAAVARTHKHICAQTNTLWECRFHIVINSNFWFKNVSRVYFRVEGAIGVNIYLTIMHCALRKKAFYINPLISRSLWGSWTPNVGEIVYSTQSIINTIKITYRIAFKSRR